MRKTSELLEIVLENLDTWLRGYGLCHCIGVLINDYSISYKESTCLQTYIENNRPNNLYTLLKEAYYWPKGWKFPRKRWLKKHIKKLKEQGL